MPSATQELRDIMKDWFGNEIDEGGPCKMLEARGWTLTKKWEWRGAVPSQTVHEIDGILITFLIEEWDFGGLERNN